MSSRADVYEKGGRLNSEKKKGRNEEATLKLLRDLLWLTTPLTVPTVSGLSSLRMKFRDGGTRKETKSETLEREGGSRRTGCLCERHDVSREDFDKGRNARLKKSRGFFLRHEMLLRENIRR